MRPNLRQYFARVRMVLWLSLIWCGGCATLEEHCKPADMPHELAEAPLSPYVIEPPDVLLVDAIRLIPKPPYHVAPMDVLGIQVIGTLPNEPIAGLYPVDPDGTINLGFAYGIVRVEGLSIAEVKTAIEKHLFPAIIKTPIQVTVVLAESRALQQIRGPHLVRPDGTIGLGMYGSVFVDGLTIADAKAAIESYLEQFVLRPEISVDVSGFNSKVYYIVTDGAGNGERVDRFPVTGKTTVLDAMSQVYGLAPVSSKHFMYLVRPTDTGKKKEEEVYHIDWNAIVRRGDARTNYQILPGDRIYVLGAPALTFNTYLSRFLTPVQQAFAAVGLGDSTVLQFVIPGFGVGGVP